MKKTKESIKQKWEKKTEQMVVQANFKYEILKQNRRKAMDKQCDYELEKLDKKRDAYIRKKEAEYKRKCLNEIREMENKPKRVYKSEWPKIKPLQFAMQIAQENSRLRDTDADWCWRCISCDTFCSWWWLAWGHRYSRRFTNICLEEENINAQCYTCNRITWPLWNPALKIKTNARYDENMDSKWWEWTSERLRLLTRDFAMWKWKKYDLNKKIPQLIKENEKLWKTKNFYKPWRKWASIWEEYAKRH